MSARSSFAEAAETRAVSSKHNVVVHIPKRFLRLAADQLPAGCTVMVCPAEEFAPEFIRLPNANENERCAVTGLSASALGELLKRAGRKIRTHQIRQPGATRGITLIHRQSLVDYIAKLPPPPAYAGEGEFQLENQDAE